MPELYRSHLTAAVIQHLVTFDNAQLAKAVGLLSIESQTFRHKALFFARAARAYEDHDLPTMSRYCAGQSLSLTHAADRMDEVFAQVFQLWQVYEADTSSYLSEDSRR